MCVFSYMHAVQHGDVRTKLQNFVAWCMGSSKQLIVQY